MIIYKKNTNLVLGIIMLIVGPLCLLSAYLIIKQYDNNTFLFYKFSIIGVVGILFGIFCIREYIKHKLVIGEDYIEIDNKKIPAFQIKGIEKEDKGWKIIIKTESQDVVIGMAGFLPLSNEEKIKEIYSRLIAVIHETSGNADLMDENRFWKTIQTTIDESYGNKEKQIDSLSKQLHQLTGKEIIEFNKIFETYVVKAYTWGLWGVAYIIGGGCSDDDFINFRYWLISKGKDVYYKVLSNPESIADIDLNIEDEMDIFFEEFGYVADNVYEDKFNAEIIDPEIYDPEEPSGNEWKENKDALRKMFPITFSKYWK
jgi:hypothetical protein